MTSAFKAILLCFLIQALNGCSGYKLVERQSFFHEHGISSIKVPLFINRTIFPDISGAYTNAVIDNLQQIKGVDVNGGSPKSLGDNVLVGILTTEPLEENVLVPLIRTFTGNSTSLNDSIGSRPDFYLTSQYRVNIFLEIILIKNPLLKSEKQIGVPKVIIRRSIPISFNVVNNIAPTNGPDSAGVVNYTNNRGFFDFEVKKSAIRAAEILENLIAL